MKNITQLFNDFRPILSLVVYSMIDQEYHGQEFYIESHDIDNKGRMLSGKPLSHETMAEVLKAFRTEKTEKIQIKGRVPSNLLFVDQDIDRYIWIVEPSKRNLFFSSELNIPDGEAFIPKLIFEARDKQLKVFAIKDLKSENPQLCYAPFHNVGEGNVCIGSAKANRVGNTYSSVLEYWEKIFFASVATAVHGKPIKGDLNALWRKHINSGKPFNNKILVETKFKLNDILK